MATKKTAKNIPGIYLRGKTYWFTHGSGKRRLQVSLDTTDYVVAVQRSQAILDNPLLNATDGFKAELDKFADNQVKFGIWTENSRKTKYSVLFMFGEDLGLPQLLNIKTAQIQKWYDQQVKRIKVVTVNAYMTTIKSLFNWAIEERKMFRNPADDVKLNQTTGAVRERFCTFEERDEIILKAPNLDLQFVLYCGFFAGYRKNEIIQSRQDWFDMSLKHVHVKTTETFTAKDKEERTIPMADEFYKFLKKYGKHSPFMLEPDIPHGKGTCRYDFRRPFEKYMKEIGYEWVTPHLMRHTFASLLAIKGVSLYKIAAWLGDTLATTEKHYAHLLPTDPDIEHLNGANSKKWKPKKGKN